MRRLQAAAGFHLSMEHGWNQDDPACSENDVEVPGQQHRLMAERQSYIWRLLAGPIEWMHIEYWTKIIIQFGLTTECAVN